MSKDCANGASCKESHCSDPLVWAKAYGDASDQTANGIALEGEGNIAVVGSFAGTLDFGAGPHTAAGGNDGFLSYLDATAHEHWTVRFGDANEQHGTHVVIGAANNMHFLGDFLGAISLGGAAGNYSNSGTAPATFVATLDASHTSHGNKSLGSAVESGAAIATDTTDNVYVTGAFNGSVDFGGGTLASNGAEDIFVLKLDPSSQHVWSKRFGDSNIQRGSVIAVDPTGNVVLGGDLNGSVDFGCGPIEGSAFIAKLDSSGNCLWSKGYSGFAVHARAVATDGSGNILVTGTYLGAANFGGEPLNSGEGGSVFVLKLDAEGTHLWSKSFGYPTGPSAATSSGIATDGTGNVFVAGDFQGKVDFGDGPISSAASTTTPNLDVFLAKLDSSGKHVWSRAYGDEGDHHANGLAADSMGNVVLVGSFQSSIDLGGGKLTSAGGYDIFVAKLAP